MRIRCYAAAIAIALCISDYDDVAGQGSSRSVRHVKAPQGKAFVDIIRPGEPEVAIEFAQAPPDEVRLPPGSLIESISRDASIILVLDILSIEGEVTHRPDSITSHVSASIVDILKAPKGWNGQTGGVATFDLPGGQANLEGTKIRVIVPWARPAEIGKRYLAFGRAPTASTRIRVGPTGMYEMTASRRFLRLAVHGGGKPDDIETAEQANVFIRIRDSVQ
jgi:hypothetical protein